MENRERIVRETEAFVKSSVPKTRQPEEAYIRHVFGARNYARHLAEIYHADIFVVVTAALLHDVAADAGESHAKESAKMAKEFLLDFNLPGKTMNKIIHCIRNHSLGTLAEALEEQIIQDSDGIIFVEDTYRTFFEEKKQKLPLDEARKHSIEKCRAMMGKIKTEEGKKIAAKFLESAVKELENAS